MSQNNGLTNLLKTQAHTLNASRQVVAGATISVDIPIGLSGYTPLAIAQISGSGTGTFAFQDLYFPTNTTCRLYLKNLATSAVTLNSITVTVLYIKS